LDAAKLQGISLFSTLSKKELEQLGRWIDEIDVKEGTHLAREGTFAHEFFIIEDGTADVRQGENTIRKLGPGDFFGEIGLLETERRTASVIAETPMRLYVMFQREFKQMERDLPSVAEKIRAAIYERLHPGETQAAEPAE
jgi:CRP-like cAMP-binding protein